MRIALLASSNVMPGAEDSRVDAFEFEEEVATLAPAFAARGMALEARLWDDAAHYARDYDALLPLMVWDYFEGNEARFLTAMEVASDKARVFNDPATLRWNADKRYLQGLAAKGAPVIPTASVDAVSEDAAHRAAETFDTDRLVIKPQVGGGAWRQALWSTDKPWPEASALPPAAALIQPFLPSIQTEGEYSLLFFGGRFSHALVKRAQPGDYRIQSSYGGMEEKVELTDEALAVAHAVLESLDDTPLYARVDLVRGLDGKLALIEIELIEPYLYLPMAEVGEDGLNTGALMLADALRARLG